MSESELENAPRSRGAYTIVPHEIWDSKKVQRLTCAEVVVLFSMIREVSAQNRLGIRGRQLVLNPEEDGGGGEPLLFEFGIGKVRKGWVEPKHRRRRRIQRLAKNHYVHHETYAKAIESIIRQGIVRRVENNPGRPPVFEWLLCRSGRTRTPSKSAGRGNRQGAEIGRVRKSAGYGKSAGCHVKNSRGINSHHNSITNHPPIPPRNPSEPERVDQIIARMSGGKGSNG